MEYYVDRIDGGIVICDAADGKTYRFSASDLPEDVFEGCVLQGQDGAFSVDLARTEERRQMLWALQDALLADMDSEAQPSENDTPFA